MSTIAQETEVLAPSRAPGGAMPLSPRDVQRDALRDVVALATECAATEARIEQEYQLATEAANKEWEKTQRATKQDHGSLAQRTAKEHQQTLEKITADYTSKAAAAKEARDHARAAIARVNAEAQTKCRNQRKEAIWLAESGLEVAQNQSREEETRVRELLKAHGEALAETEGRAKRLLARYRQKPPTVAQPDVAAELEGQELQAAMTAQNEASRGALERMRNLLLPKLFVGILPWFILLAGCAGAGIAGHFLRGGSGPHIKTAGIAAGAALVVLVTIGLLLRKVAKAKVNETYLPLAKAIIVGREAALQYDRREAAQRAAFYEAAVKTRDAEVLRLKTKAANILKTVQQKFTEDGAKIDAEYQATLAGLASKRDQATAEAQKATNAATTTLEQQKAANAAAALAGHQHEINASRQSYERQRAELQRRLRDGLADIQTPLGGDGDGQNAPLEDASRWIPPRTFPALVRFGEMLVDFKTIADAGNANGKVTLDFPPAFSVPAALAFPRGASLLIQHEPSGRQQAIGLIQAVMTRLLTTLPPARARFTIIDPVGLGQSFAGFMRLADHDEALVGARIWTETEQIEKRLADITEHMETVIQKYLRNEYPTIDDYNAQAGELAEPYRFVVVADFPSRFQGDAFRRLASLAATGARCGVYVLISRDLRRPVPADGQLDDLEAHCVNLVEKDQRFVWQDDVFAQFPLTLDAPPPENVMAPLLDRIGKAAADSKRVEVSFDAIAPPEQSFWTGDSKADLSVPIGRMGATRLQMMRLGRGVAQHSLIAGKTGSGKSTLLHAIITNLAMWYSPHQVELYLIDFKKGVEFKTYAAHKLPHARAIAVESDREFGLSVLQRLDGELGRRGELFRAAAVQDLAAYRSSPGAQIMPRTLLIIDEYQEFFSEDDKVAQEASLLLDRLVRQGRAFGIHMLLGSQSISGTSGLARSTIGQMAVRVALQTSEADSQLILGDGNSAARLLSRPGEAIYNDAGGLVEANSPFQVAWLPDEKRDGYLEKVSRLATSRNDWPPAPIIFEGNGPADLRTNVKLSGLLRSAPPTIRPGTALAWIGEPVAIKESTALTLRHQSGANVLLVGQQEEEAMSVMLTAMISLAAQYPPGGALFYVMDSTPADSQFAGLFERVRPVVRQEMRVLEWRAIPETLQTLAAGLGGDAEESAGGGRAEDPDDDALDAPREERPEPVPAAASADPPTARPEIFLFIYGLQSFRMLRKTEDDFSFSSSDEPKKPNPSKAFAEILREGPGAGVHVITWVDSSTSIERVMDRNAVREFDNRILFQMSAADSSGLIDSPAANKLGFHRAMVYSEERGVMEKFRPYALPSADWLAEFSGGAPARA